MMPYLMTSAKPARNSRSWQSLERVEVAQNQLRLIKSADEIFAGLQIDADLAADGAVHQREQRCRRLNEGNSAQISRRDEAGQIADDPAAERDDEGFSFQPLLRKMVVTGLNRFEAFRGFTRGNDNQHWRKTGADKGIKNHFGIAPADVGVCDDGATPAKFQAGAFAAVCFSKPGAIMIE